MAIGVPPRKGISLNLSGLDADQFVAIGVKLCESFGWKCSYIYKDGFVAYTTFSLRSFGEEMRFSVEDDDVFIESKSTGLQLFDLGKNKSNLEKFISHYKNFQTIITAKTQENINQFAKKIILDLEEEDSIFLQPPSNFRNSIEDFVSLFVPTKGYTVIPILADLNIIVFILLTITGSDLILSNVQTLYDWGANTKIEVNNGQYWRLITSLFLHAGIVHLFFNMWVLIYIGLLLEPYLRKTKTLMLYLISGISASLSSHLFRHVPISVGASGAIFGLIGGFLALLVSDVFDKNVRRSYLIAISIFVVYNLLSVFSNNTTVDNAAHIGGLISGFIVGYLYIPTIKFNYNSKKWNIVYSILAILFFGSVISFLYIKNKNVDNFSSTEALMQYSLKMRELNTTSNMAMNAYEWTDDLTEEDYKKNLKDIGIYFWNEDLRLIQELKETKLPVYIQNYNDQLKFYFQTRIKQFDLIYQSVQDDSDEYDDKLDAIDSTIQIKLRLIDKMEQHISQTY
ncbi:rhomboid family intramembrane serine protease [Rhizosphaericola mali]|uniref:Rhomboid family intramembrane serine protease n=1 Tax=Rhizosphaericola mali TaxID=2545455 RepID=A0A5P2G0N0_9BACT|nr:rhomboid family intramembrane serine protease [Rhizosphaericola mali]QES89364.1 rhomboid family intramembrane serine protease [Rhizosphaericola mali]